MMRSAGARYQPLISSTVPPEAGAVTGPVWLLAVTPSASAQKALPVVRVSAVKEPPKPAPGDLRYSCPCTIWIGASVMYGGKCTSHGSILYVEMPVPPTKSEPVAVCPPSGTMATSTTTPFAAVCAATLSRVATFSGSPSLPIHVITVSTACALLSLVSVVPTA